MFDSGISKISDFNQIIEQKNFNKIFLITGKNSFFKSEANLLFKFSKKKNVKYYYKKSILPEYDELLIILNEIHNFKPDVYSSAMSGS